MAKIRYETFKQNSMKNEKKNKKTLKCKTKPLAFARN